ncbi:MAG TPA: ChuX/HutX family heme-like substrate-binding protein [Kiritimatiellia bacterium]|nr:ChuX/HutX family heme-like substrate-binding protein [Kiritimatiellia bacterium]
MSIIHTLSAGTGADLQARYLALKTTKSQARMRDLAAELGAPEGALIASCCGADAVRLKPEWLAFLPALETLGPVMALTRNEAIVHEKDGTFANVGFFGSMAQVVNHDIDLRIFLRHWRHLFAFSQTKGDDLQLSFQIFDGRGQAVLKIFLRKESNHAAYRHLVESLIDSDQAPDFTADIVAPPAPVLATATQEALAARWRNLRDTHDFYPMIRELGLTRRDANAMVGDEFARPLPGDCLEAFLRRAAESGVSIMIFVGNPGCIQIHTGPVHRIERFGEWVNVLDPDFNLHARADLIAEAWLVRKPTADGIVTSIELFDTQGGELALIFGERKPGRPEMASWRALLDDHFPLSNE